MEKKKIGRNDPCPCGSGIKYKKCCLGKALAPNSPDYHAPRTHLLRQRTSNRTSIEIRNSSPPNDPKIKQKRRKQHYVPVWYQKRFLPDVQNALHYLNLNPIKYLPDGRQVKLRKIYKWGPKNCFFKKDLYTTKFFGTRNEDIEEFLFGNIDNEGCNAIDALVVQDFKILPDCFPNIFGFMDAQKLRTPKGLEWIRSNYFQLSQLELMVEMQFLRTMHCTMWIEGVLEIVSAEDSDIKFIISDHPVTVYNPACAPDSHICQYPNDPPIAWKGSQTIFPLDLNHCFILTNLEYARDPSKVDPLTSRTNPRYFAQTLTRWDAVIRDRRLKPEEVCAINYIVKSRARKYIASAQQEWLYPENYLSQNEWEPLHKVVLPPNNKLYMFGGEIFVGKTNGGLIWHQDEFGRKHTSQESGDDPAQKYSIKERNQILCNAILEIFGFSKGKSWNDFRNELTDDKIKELYGVVGSLWNPDTEIMNLIPKPSNELRAFYNGTIDPRVIPLTVLGYSLYVDKIIMISPFPNPRAINKEYSPYEFPSQYRNDTIKNVFTMMQIMPLINAGIVDMIPDPGDFDSDFRYRIYKIAEARVKSHTLGHEDIEYAEKLMRDDFRRSMLNLPPENIKHQIKQALPHLSDEQVEEVVEYAHAEKFADPLASLQPLSPGEKGAQLQIFRMGGSLEMALYLAQATGSFVYTDINYRWKELQSSALIKHGEESIDPWAPVAQALNNTPFIVRLDVDPYSYSRIKENGALNEFTSLYRRLCNSVREIKDPNAVSTEAKELANLISQVDIKSIWGMLEKGCKNLFKGNLKNTTGNKAMIPIHHSIPIYGLSTNTITQILLTHGSNIPHWDSVPFGAFLDVKNVSSGN